jgi:hypothetical protein
MCWPKTYEHTSCYGNSRLNSYVSREVDRRAYLWNTDRLLLAMRSSPKDNKARLDVHVRQAFTFSPWCPLSKTAVKSHLGWYHMFRISIAIPPYSFFQGLIVF